MKTIKNILGFKPYTFREIQIKYNAIYKEQPKPKSNQESYIIKNILERVL